MSRLWLPFVILFWIFMNVLLWRSEYGDSIALGSPLPASVVWEKMLQTPDISSLELRQRGHRIGFCQWSVIQKTSIEEAPLAEEMAGADEMEGMIEEIVGYQIRLEGSLSDGDDPLPSLRFSFSIHLKPDTENWSEMDLKISKKGNWIQISAKSEEGEFQVQHNHHGQQSSFRFSFEDFQNPASWATAFGLGEFGLPIVSGLQKFEWDEMDWGVEWEAGAQFLTLAHTRVRVYFLKTTLFEDYSIELILSRAGEIVQARFPNEIQLVNESFSGL